MKITQRTTTRRSAAVLAATWMAATAAVSFGSSLFAQETWPNKPIRLVVPYPAGTPPDITARLIGNAIAPALGQPVVIDNKPGALGVVGLSDVLRQPADGYTLFGLVLPLTAAPAMLPSAKVDLLRDTEPVAQVDWTYSVLVVNKDLPARNIKELIALLKAKPSDYSYASGGIGTPAHLTAEIFKLQQKVSAQHVPYAQFAQAVPDLVGNRVQFMFLTSSVAVAQVNGGNLRALAVIGTQRLAALPQVPTMAEEGLGDFDARGWDGIVVKNGTPREIVERLNREIVKAVNTPKMQERFTELGLTPAAGSPKEFGDLIKREVTKWTRVIQQSGIKAE